MRLGSQGSVWGWEQTLAGLSFGKAGVTNDRKRQQRRRETAKGGGVHAVGEAGGSAAQTQQRRATTGNTNQTHRSGNETVIRGTETAKRVACLVDAPRQTNNKAGLPQQPAPLVVARERLCSLVAAYYLALVLAEYGRAYHGLRAEARVRVHRGVELDAVVAVVGDDRLAGLLLLARHPPNNTHECIQVCMCTTCKHTHARSMEPAQWSQLKEASGTRVLR